MKLQFLGRILPQIRKYVQNKEIFYAFIFMFFIGAINSGVANIALAEEIAAAGNAQNAVSIPQSFILPTFSPNIIAKPAATVLAPIKPPEETVPSVANTNTASDADLPYSSSASNSNSNSILTEPQSQHTVPPPHLPKITLTRLLDTDTPFEATRNTHFINFSAPLLSHQEILFAGMNNKKALGIFRLSPTLKLETIATTNFAIPGGQGKFTNFGMDNDSDDFTEYQADNLPMLWNGAIAFLGNGEFGQSGLFFYENSQIKKIADQNSNLFNQPDENNQFSQIAFQDDVIAFRNVMNGETDGIFIYKIKEQKFELMLASQTLVPARILKHKKSNAKPDVFTKLWHPQLADNQMVFRGVTEQNNEGIYRVDITTHHLEKIADREDRMPNNKKHFYLFGAPFITQQGDVCFDAQGNNEQDGIYFYLNNQTQVASDKNQRPNHLFVMLDSNVMIPGSQQVFENFHNVTCQSPQQFVFLGTGKNGLVGIFYYENGILTTVISQGMRLGWHTVQQLSLAQGAYENHSLVFLVTFKDGSRAIYRADLT